MSTYMTLEEYTATLKVGDEVTIKYYVPEWAVKAFEEGILYFDALTPDTPPIELFIRTLEGTMHAPVGSYVIQGVRGEIYCCKEDIFLETYEPVLERE